MNSFVRFKIKNLIIRLIQFLLNLINLRLVQINKKYLIEKNLFFQKDYFKKLLNLKNQLLLMSVVIWVHLLHFIKTFSE